MPEFLTYRLSLPPGAVAPVNVVRVGDKEINIPNTIVQRGVGTLIIAGELSARTRGLLAGAGVQIEVLNGGNGNSGNGKVNGRAHANGARPNLDELFARLGNDPPDDPDTWDARDVFAQHNDFR